MPGRARPSGTAKTGHFQKNWAACAARKPDMTPASLIRVKGVFPAIGMADAGALPLLSCVQLGQFFLNHGHHFGGNLVLPFTGGTNGILRDGRDLFGQLLA